MQVNRLFLFTVVSLFFASACNNSTGRTTGSAGVSGASVGGVQGAQPFVASSQEDDTSDSTSTNSSVANPSINLPSTPIIINPPAINLPTINQPVANPFVQLTANGQLSSHTADSSGDSVAFAWVSNNVDECSFLINGELLERLPLVGIKTIQVSENASYTVLCTSGIVKVQDSVNVLVPGVVIKAAKQLKLVGSTSIIAGQCNGPYKIYAYDEDGDLAKVNAALSLSLQISNRSDLIIYNNQQCTTTKTSFNIASGSSQAVDSIYLKASQIGSTPRISLAVPSNSILQGDALEVSVVKGFGSSLSFVENPASVKAGVCHEVSLYAQTALGDTAGFYSTQQIDINASGGAKLYANSGCTQEISKINFAPQDARVQYYLKSSNLGSTTLTAEAMQESITAAQPLVMTVGSTSSPSSLRQVVQTLGGIDNDYTQHRFGNNVRAVQLLERLSNASCDFATSYGEASNYVWLNKGCRGSFRIFYLP